MVISREQLEEMLRVARDAFPDEGCGLLGGVNGEVRKVYPIRNADASPIHFTLDTKEQFAAVMDMDDHDWDIAGVFHSHTHSPARPSATDIEWARGTSALYPETLHVIVSLARPETPDVRAYRIEGDSVEEVPVQVRG